MVNYIYFDMDGVICNTLKKWLWLYNNDYNDNLRPEDITKWGLYDIVKPECGKKILDYIKRSGFFIDLEPLEGAVETIKYTIELLGINKVYICTTSPPNGFMEKYLWIQRHLPELKKNIIFTDNKGVINTYNSILIDDAEHNLEAFSLAGGNAVCFDAPYNRHLKGYKRVYGWDDVKKLINYLKV